MIDFRYHVVSLISVFLALALGIIIGTTKLNGPVLDDLRSQVNGLQEDKNDLETTIRNLESQGEAGDEFAAAVAPQLLANRLREASVVLILLPDADHDVVDSMQAMLEQASATVTGKIQIAHDYADPRRSAELAAYASSGVLPPGFQMPTTEDGGVLGAALIGRTLMISPETGQVPNSAELRQVLSGLASMGMVRLESDDVAPADYAVIVTSGTIRGSDAGHRSDTLSELAVGLDRSGRGAVVLGGPASAQDGVIGHIRGNEDWSSAVSTVDSGDRTVGQMATVFALAQQGQGRSGHFGTVQTANDVFPELT